MEEFGTVALNCIGQPTGRLNALGCIYIDKGVILFLCLEEGFCHDPHNTLLLSDLIETRIWWNTFSGADVVEVLLPV